MAGVNNNLHRAKAVKNHEFYLSLSFRLDKENDIDRRDTSIGMNGGVF